MKNILLLLCIPATLSAAEDVGTAQARRDLANDFVVMNLSAHPDDEDGASLAYYRMKFGATTYSVFFTRGEGGQNETGPELYEDLGVLRTAETRAAARMQGTEAIFLNFSDFGFSKTATETFHEWGGSREVLRRLVYVIRKYKPDILFTHHNTVTGHGHHQVVAITALTAFDAAADSTQFPEQLVLPGISVWQPRKLFFRLFSRGDQQPDVVNTIAEVDPLRHESYLDIAASALRMHKTQGMDRADLRRFSRGVSLYRLMRQNSIYEDDTTSFFSGIDLWRDPSLATLISLRDRVHALSTPSSDQNTIRQSSVLLREVDSLLAGPPLSPLACRIAAGWKENIERLATHVAGVTIRTLFGDSVVVARQKVPVTLTCTGETSVDPGFRASLSLPSGWHSPAVPLTGRIGSPVTAEVLVGPNPTTTVPRRTAQYNPLESREEMTLTVHWSWHGLPLTTTLHPMPDVAPGEDLRLDPAIVHLPATVPDRGTKIAFSVHNFFPHPDAGRLTMTDAAGWILDASPYTIAREDSAYAGTMFIRPPRGIAPGAYTLRVASAYASQSLHVHLFDVAVPPDMTVGIIRSYDTTLEAVLDELGVTHRLIDDDMLAHGDLRQFQTIVVDIRAYLVRDSLCAHNNRVLDYVKQGGNLVVMYQKDQEWKSSYAPFPFDITRRRITYEEAPVTVLAPDHPLVRSPNAITEADWDGWIQERAVYLPGNVPPEYTRLLSSGDPDEVPSTTGYIVARYGEGSYIYSSYVWYRQLKEVNPGAFRCFANMIAYRMRRQP